METEIIERLDKVIAYLQKLNERYEELRETFEGEKRVSIEMVSMLVNDLIALRNSLDKLFERYIKLLEKLEKK